MPPPSFSSLPNDTVWEILARVPKRYYPMLSRVCKNFRRIVRSPEIHKIRFRLRKDSLFLCLEDETMTTHRWVSLRIDENNPIKYHVDSIDLRFPYQREANPCIIAIGPEIFFICGSFFPSSTMFIFDSRTRTLRQGPSSRANRLYTSVGLVGSKIYVFGRYRDDEMHVESFDVKTQTWELAPPPEKEGSWITWSISANVSLDRKVCTLEFKDPVVNCYNPKDGSCEIFDLPKDKWWRMGVCVIDNVLYVYFERFGLMWYDSELRLWRSVSGLRLVGKVKSVAMAEYYGKLAFWWEICGETNKFGIRMVALDRSEKGVRGTPETTQVPGILSPGYTLQHFLSVSD